MSFASPHARTTLGLDEAIRRARAFAGAGADVIFVESPESEAEFERIGQEVDAPLLANMVEGGRSPILPADTLERLGYTVVIYPGTAFGAAAAALDAVYRHLREHGSSRYSDVPMFDIEKMNTLMGFEEVWAFERKWAERTD